MSENIQMEDDGPDRSVLNNQFSSVTPSELATKAKETDINPNGFQKAKSLQNIVYTRVFL